MRMLYSLEAEEPAEGDPFAPEPEKEGVTDLKEKKKNWRKSVGKAFRVAARHNII